MDTNDVRDLLPFFVAGTLEPDQKRMVEEALATSEELQKDLQFWKRVQQVVVARQAERAAGHLTSQQIVNRALGALTGDELLSVDNHLRSCPTCSEDLMLLNQSLEAKQGDPDGWSQRFAKMIRSVRLVYAVPALAVIIAVCIFIIGRSGEQPTPPSTKDTTPPILVESQKPDEKATSIRLSYRPEMRSTTRENLPVLTLDDEDTLIHLFVSIPHNSVGGIRYRLAVFSKGRRPYHVQDLVGRYASGDECDSLHFVLSRDVLALPGGTTTLAISEILPKELNSLTPEEYRINFVIRAKH